MRDEGAGTAHVLLFVIEGGPRLLGRIGIRLEVDEIWCHRSVWRSLGGAKPAAVSKGGGGRMGWGSGIGWDPRDGWDHRERIGATFGVCVGMWDLVCGVRDLVCGM